MLRLADGTPVVQVPPEDLLERLVAEPEHPAPWWLDLSHLAVFTCQPLIHRGDLRTARLWVDVAELAATNTHSADDVILLTRHVNLEVLIRSAGGEATDPSILAERVLAFMAQHLGSPTIAQAHRVDFTDLAETDSEETLRWRRVRNALAPICGRDDVPSSVDDWCEVLALLP